MIGIPPQDREYVQAANTPEPLLAGKTEAEQFILIDLQLFESPSSLDNELIHGHGMIPFPILFYLSPRHGLKIL